MRKWKPDFAKPNNSESWYDIEDDWELIATSLKTQYGYSVRAKIDTMDWGELAPDILFNARYSTSGMSFK